MTWNTIVFGNTLADWTVAAAITVGLLLALRVLKGVLARWSARDRGDSKGRIAGYFDEVLGRTSFLLLTVLALCAGSLAVDVSEEFGPLRLGPY